MGSVADKIAKKIISSGASKVVDLASWREGRTMALEAGFGDDGLALGELAGHDPCHALYVVAENVASLMAESISGMREVEGLLRQAKLGGGGAARLAAVLAGESPADAILSLAS